MGEGRKGERGGEGVSQDNPFKFKAAVYSTSTQRLAESELHCTSGHVGRVRRHSAGHS